VHSWFHDMFVHCPTVEQFELSYYNYFTYQFRTKLKALDILFTVWRVERDRLHASHARQRSCRRIAGTLWRWRDGLLILNWTFWHV